MRIQRLKQQAWPPKKAGYKRVKKMRRYFYDKFLQKSRSKAPKNFECGFVGLLLNPYLNITALGLKAYFLVATALFIKAPTWSKYL